MLFTYWKTGSKTEIFMLWLKEITDFVAASILFIFYDIQMNPVKISHEQNTEHTHNKEIFIE